MISWELIIIVSCLDNIVDLFRLRLQLVPNFGEN